MTTTKQQVCKSCLWKKQESVFKWSSIASADFPWEKDYVVDKWGIKIVDCSRCKGTGLEPVFEKQVISKKETTEQQSENILTYEQWIERGRQIGYKEWRKKAKKSHPVEQERNEKIVKVWRCNCEWCMWHNIKPEYKVDS